MKNFALGAFGAAVTVLILLLGAHLWQDHSDEHLIMDLLKYNVAAGRLLQLPGPGGIVPASKPDVPKAEKPEKP